MRGGLLMRRMLVAGMVILAAVSFRSTALAQGTDTPAQFKGVKVTERPDGLAVAIETSGPIKYQAALFEAPDRIVIDMAGTYAASRSRWTTNPEPIREIRGSQWKPDTARLVVELTRHATYRIQEEPNGLTVTVAPSASAPLGLSKPTPKLPVLGAAPARPDAPASEPARFPAPPSFDTPKPDVVKRDLPRTEMTAKPAVGGVRQQPSAEGAAVAGPGPASRSVEARRARVLAGVGFAADHPREEPGPGRRGGQARRGAGG